MAGEDPEHLERVRWLPCCVCGKRENAPPHHITGAGLALREHDHNAIPLCNGHHRQLHDLNGHFKGWDREGLRLWQLHMVTETRTAVEMVFDVDVPDDDAF